MNLDQRRVRGGSSALEEGRTSPGLDDPIRSSDDDLLERKPFAHALARQIVAAPTDARVVMAVLGAWGNGKSSVLQMAHEHVLELAPSSIMFDFNPWLFDTTEQLVARFLDELGARIEREASLGKRTRKRASKELRTYATAITSLGTLLLGPAGALAGQIGTAAAQGSGTHASVHDSQMRVVKALRELARPIIVLLDDIDRLTPAEMRDVMRLTKLVGDFPNTVFVLAFDAERVVAALEKSVGAGQGRAYVEKIVQVPANLPAPAPHHLMTVLDAELRELLRRGDHDDVAKHPRWGAVRSRVLQPCLGNLRDVRRYLAAISMTVELLSQELDLVDILALEALRVFAPRLFAALPAHVALLTRFPGWERLFTDATDLRSAAADRADELDAFTAYAGNLQSVAIAACELLFPASRADAPDEQLEWRRNRRVAVEQNLFYFLRHSHDPRVVANVEMQAIITALGDAERLARLFDGRDTAWLQMVVRRLGEEPAGRIAPRPLATAGALLAILESLPPMGRNTLGIDEQGELIRLIGMFVEAIDPADQGDAALEELASGARTLSQRFVVVAKTKPTNSRDRRERARSLPSMSQLRWDALQERFARELLGTTAEHLRREQLLPQLVGVLSATVAGCNRLRVVGEDDALLIRVLDESVVQEYEGPHALALPWDDLVRIFSREWLERRVSTLESRPDLRERSGVRVARHHLDHDGKPLPLQPDA